LERQYYTKGDRLGEFKEFFYESMVVLINTLEKQDDTFLESPFPDTDYNIHYLIDLLQTE
jgi:hypothetical protein